MRIISGDDKMSDSLINTIMGISPFIEILIRKIYWHSDLLIKFNRSSNKNKVKVAIPVTSSLERLENKLKELGIKEGDLLIVHSSYNILKQTGATPNEIIDVFLNLIGENGTLAMPTIPRWEDKINKNLMKEDITNTVIQYDPDNTPAWTGIITNLFLKYPKVERSLHPLNTMAAFGPLAKPMMKNNISGFKPLPCGENSSWKYCADHGAKIIALGADMTHSLTMIHVVEDAYNEQWPIKEWYRDRKCIVFDNGEKRDITVRERHPKWAIHYAERTLYKDLLKSGVMTKDFVDGIKIELINDSRNLIDFLQERNKKGYPYYFIRRSFLNGKN